MEPNGTIKHFLLPDCDNKKLELIDVAIGCQKNLLFLRRWDIMSKEKFLQIVNLSDVLNNNNSGICVSIANAYFGENKMFIYRIEDGNILKRWLVTPDGNLTNPRVVVKTKDVCFSSLTLITRIFSGLKKLSFIRKAS